MDWKLLAQMTSEMVQKRKAKEKANTINILVVEKVKLIIDENVDDSQVIRTSTAKVFTEEF